MKVLLVGNREGDGLRSMERFGDMLLRGLRDAGVEVEMVRPARVFGKRSKWLGYMEKFVLFWFTFRKAHRERPGWIVHVIDQGNGIYAGWAPGCVVTCHDLFAIRAARGEVTGLRIGWSGRIFQSMILRGLRRAGGIVCVSDETRRDVERLIGKSEVISNGLEEKWRPLEDDEAWTRFQTGGIHLRDTPYLLHVGGDAYYKNRPAVVRTFIELRERFDFRLVMVGPKLDAALMGELKKAGLEGEVTVLPDISDETLQALYAKARGFFFPSITEGFGWPILEAQACGCPVVTRDAEPMRTIGGRGAIYASDGKWTQALVRVLEMDEPDRNALIEAGRENARRYSVGKMAREYVAYYQRRIA